MKEEGLLRALGEVDDKFVESSAPINLCENNEQDTFYEQSSPQIITVKKHSPMMKIAGIGAACAAAVGIGFALKFMASQGDTGLLTNPAANPGDSISLSEEGKYIHDAIGVVKRWNELAINEQYNLFTFYGSVFNSGGSTVSEDMLYGFLGNVTAQGYDVYEDKTYEKEASVYSIKNLSEKGVVAVKFAEDENYYIYFTHDYKPYTLGYFIEELNLRENIVFGDTASCTTVENGYPKGYLTYMIDWNYSRVDSEKIWELLSDADIRTESIFDYKDFDERLETELEFSVDIPILGIKNHSMQVTKGGFVHTNMFFGQSMLFNVGKDKTDAFVKYVKENCKGEIVRQSEQKTDENPEPDGETSPAYDPTISNSVDTTPEYPELPQ